MGAGERLQLMLDAREVNPFGAEQDGRLYLLLWNQFVRLGASARYICRGFRFQSEVTDPDRKLYSSLTPDVAPRSLAQQLLAGLDELREVPLDARQVRRGSLGPEEAVVLRPSAAAMPGPLRGGRRGRAEGRGVEGGPTGEDGEVAVGGELLGGLDQVREIHLNPPLLSLGQCRTLHLISTSPNLFHVFGFGLGFGVLSNFFAA